MGRRSGLILRCRVHESYLLRLNLAEGSAPPGTAGRGRALRRVDDGVRSSGRSIVNDNPEAMK